MQDHGRKDVEPMNKFDMMGKDALSKVEEIMNATKLNEFLHRKEEEEKKKTCILWILAIIGVVLRMVYTDSSHRIIWKISKTILKMTSMTTSSRMMQKTTKNKTLCDAIKCIFLSTIR